VAARFPGASLVEYEYDFFGYDANLARQIADRVQAAPRTVFVLATPGGVGYLKLLEPYKDKLVVVSVLTPVYLKDLPWVKDALAVYGTNTQAFDVAAAVLAGDFTPRGKLPMKFGAFPEAVQP
jgi:beta-N-acetylhexosaminidase